MERLKSPLEDVPPVVRRRGRHDPASTPVDAWPQAR